MTKYNTFTLDNGLRIIHLPSNSKVVFCGIAVKAGTRDEQASEEGLAHFCEHLSFKGTERRSAVQIINAIEGLGGELNAFTNKEDTVYYCAIQTKHFMKAADVLVDIVFHSTYPQQEVEKEREVVCDEIESYEDSPAELIFDDIENILFEGHPLGHNILGTVNRVRAYNSDDAKRFVSRYYRPDNCVFFVNGDIDFNSLVRWLKKNCKTVSSQSALTPRTHFPPVVQQNAAIVRRQRGTHQAHIVMGTLGYAVDDKKRWALYLLNNILGGPGLNSLLNMTLRERHGLVYSVDSSIVSYGDTGLVCIYFGCDSNDVKVCIRLVRRVLDKLMNTTLNERQMKKAKQQLQGQLSIASDNREQFTLDFARTFLHQDKERNLNDIIEHIEGVTADELKEVACELFADNRITTLVYE